MPEEETIKMESPPTAEIVRPQTSVSFYVNGTRLAMSFADIRMYLLDMGPPLSPGPLPLNSSEPQQQLGVRVACEYGCLIFTPEFLKILARALNAAVDQYEAQFGKIRDKPIEPPPQNK